MDRADIELMHYGVKGMKWGVRRSDAQLAKAAKKREASSDDANEVADLRSKTKGPAGVSTLSNAELKTINERMNLEQNFANLSSKEAERNMTKGQKFVDNLGKTLAKTVQQQAQQNLNKQIKEALDQ